MKKAMISILIGCLIFSGCSGKTARTGTGKDITVYYGVSSYAMFGAEQAVIDKILGQYSSLRFEKTEDKLDLFTAFHVIIFNREKLLAKFWVDQNGVFWRNGETQDYKVISGSFDYKYLRTVYENSKNELKSEP